ncbi:MAG: LON peptidase substrate-binding domain-containing protein [Cognaticolwellia sp.]
MPTTNLPIFPLSIFLLPQGVTRLRIFEARYLKMVSLAMKNNGFVIVPAISNTDSEHTDGKNSTEEDNDLVTGSWVEIINFDQGDDGLLLIDVCCKCLVDITDMTQDKDQLHHGNITIKDHWPDAELDETTGEFALSLEKLFAENVDLSSLYPSKSLEQGSWVVARWLELLPVSIDEKLLFTEQGSFKEAKQFLENIISSENEIQS